MKSTKLISIIGIIFFLGKSIYAQNFEHLTGMYQVTEYCQDRSLYEEKALVGDQYFTYVLTIKDSEIDSLITLSSYSEEPMIFPIGKPITASISRDSFNILLQETEEPDLNFNMKIQGKGLFKGDSIFYNYSLYRDIHYYWVCESKGKWVSEVSIKKPVSVNICNVFFDHRQQSVILEGLQETVQFELYNISGQCVLKRVADGSPIPIPDLLNGVYPYRISKNGRLLQSGKILK